MVRVSKAALGPGNGAAACSVAGKNDGKKESESEVAAKKLKVAVAGAHLCPITGDLMVQPVMAEAATSGYSIAALAAAAVGVALLALGGKKDRKMEQEIASLV